MKSLLKSIFLTGSLLISGSFMSKDKDFSLSIGAITSTTLNFEVMNAENISLSIYSDKSGEVFSEKIEAANTVIKSYDLRTLEMGTYYLIAESDNKVEKYKISIDYQNKVSIDKKPVSQIKKPSYTISENSVNLVMESLQNPATVSVSDFAGNVYYNEIKNTEGGNLSLIFKLNPLIADKYIISVEEGGNIFIKIISLK